MIATIRRLALPIAITSLLVNVLVLIVSIILRWLAVARGWLDSVVFVSNVSMLALVFSDEGYAASVRQLPVVGEQLCQQHCPVSHVAHEFPQLCEAETEAISRVLGTHVQRLATIAHGDGVCTTCIPDVEGLDHRVSTGSTTERNVTP